MAAISHATVSNAFSLMKLWISIKISLKFVPKSPINIIDTDNGLAPTRRQVIIWTNDD